MNYEQYTLNIYVLLLLVFVVTMNAVQHMQHKRSAWGIFLFTSDGEKNLNSEMRWQRYAVAVDPPHWTNFIWNTDEVKYKRDGTPRSNRHSSCGKQHCHPYLPSHPQFIVVHKLKHQWIFIKGCTADYGVYTGRIVLHLPLCSGACECESGRYETNMKH